MKKKADLEKKFSKSNINLFFELETFLSCSGFIFMMMFEVTWLNVKKKLTSPLWELPQGGSGRNEGKGQGCLKTSIVFKEFLLENGVTIVFLNHGLWLLLNLLRSLYLILLCLITRIWKVCFNHKNFIINENLFSAVWEIC